jgi:hypothetical protein
MTDSGYDAIEAGHSTDQLADPRQAPPGTYDDDEAIHRLMLHIAAGGSDGAQPRTRWWVLLVVATVTIGGLVGFRLTAGRERATMTDTVPATHAVQGEPDTARHAAVPQGAVDRPDRSLMPQEDRGPTSLEPRQPAPQHPRFRHHQATRLQRERRWSTAQAAQPQASAPAAVDVLDRRARQREAVRTTP